MGRVTTPGASYFFAGAAPPRETGILGALPRPSPPPPSIRLETARTGKPEGIPRRSAAAAASMTLGRARPRASESRTVSGVTEEASGGGSRGHGASSRSQVESRRGRRRWAGQSGWERTSGGANGRRGGRTTDHLLLGKFWCKQEKEGGGRDGGTGENAYGGGGGRGDGVL